MLGKDGIPFVLREADRRCIYDAMSNAVQEVDEVILPDYIAKGYPWITFVSFRYREETSDLPPEIIEFTKKMVNRTDILKSIRSRDFEPGSYLVRIPLPLKSYIGRMVTANEFDDLYKIIEQLAKIKKEKGNEDHILLVQNYISNSISPIEQVYSQSLVLIVRDDETFSLLLK